MGELAFFESLDVSTAFADLADPDRYTPLPEDWVIGVSDIVGSTLAVADGKYKTVNMIGAAVISAQINAHAGFRFPYVFGGDGAGFAVPAERREVASKALTAVRSWAKREFGMTLRVALVPMSEIRAQGLDVSVARHQANDAVDYAMFSGGGLSWAEARMKEGAFAVPEGADLPDLTGLSCRWSHAPARKGVILSVVIAPATPASDPQFLDAVAKVVGIVGELDRDGHPVPPEGPGTDWPPAGATLEAHASRGDGALGMAKIRVLFETLIAWVLLKSGLKLGGFDPLRYRKTVGQNADFRKFDDGLKMTLDCDRGTVDRLRRTLNTAEAAGVLRFGLHEQKEAMMTCFVPSIMTDDHVHFIDGAGGGYTQAAAQIKSRSS